MWLAPPEYVIVRKRQFFRDGGSVKHLQDIRNMLHVLGDRIDRASLEAQAAALGLMAEWRKVDPIR